MNKFSMSLQTAALPLIFAFGVSCSKAPQQTPQTTQSTAKVEAYGEYRVIYKGPLGPEKIAVYNGETISMDRIRKYFRPIVDVEQRKIDFAIASAYKQLTSTLESNGIPTEIVFHTRAPEAPLVKLLKLVGGAEKEHISVRYEPTENKSQTFVKMGTQTYALSEINLNHSTYLALEKKAYDLTLKGIFEIITHGALNSEAAKQNSTVTALLQKNNLGTGELATDQEIVTYLKTLNLNVTQIEPKVFEKFRSVVTQRKQDKKVKNFVARKLLKGPVEIYLNASSQSVLSIPEKDTAYDGRSDAAVSVVIFTDLMCDNCQEAWPQLRKLQAEFGKNIRLGFRNLFHENDQRGHFVAESSQCIQQQSPQSLWTYLDAIHKDGQIVDEALINQAAKDAGVDFKRFRKCLTQRKTKATVDRQMQSAQAMGLRKIPSVVVNGKLLANTFGYRDLSSEVRKNIVIVKAKKNQISTLENMWTKIKELL